MPATVTRCSKVRTENRLQDSGNCWTWQGQLWWPRGVGGEAWLTWVSEWEERNYRRWTQTGLLGNPATKSRNRGGTGKECGNQEFLPRRGRGESQSVCDADGNGLRRKKSWEGRTEENCWAGALKQAGRWGPVPKYRTWVITRGKKSYESGHRQIHVMKASDILLWFYFLHELGSKGPAGVRAGELFEVWESESREYHISPL